MANSQDTFAIDINPHLPGVIYDKFQPSGLKISLFLTAGLVGFILILTAISSLAALDSKWRKDGLGSPWRKPKDQREE